MAGFLLDTNVISETRRSSPDSGVMTFLAASDAAELLLSVMTLGELRKGVAMKRRTDPDAADRIGAWVDGIETDFAGHVLPITAAIACRWGELSSGRSLPVIDTLIAATAIEHGLTLATRNAIDVAATGAAIFDPWQVR